MKKLTENRDLLYAILFSIILLVTFTVYLFLIGIPKTKDRIELIKEDNLSSPANK